MMVSLLEDNNSLGDTSLSPYLQILNNSEGFSGNSSDDIGNVTIEHVDVSKISDDYILDKNFLTQNNDSFDIGIEAGDVNSLLEQFEESQATCASDVNPEKTTFSSNNNNLSKSKMQNSGQEKSKKISIKEIAKKIAPVKRKSTILLENVNLPLKRTCKPQSNGPFRQTSSLPSSLPCSYPNSLPNSAPNSLPASLPSSCNSSRSCSPVQWTAPFMDHDYCVSPKVHQPVNDSDSLKPLCTNKENGEIMDKATPDKKEETKKELYMGKYKIKKRHHRHHHHHHHRHHQNTSDTLRDVRFILNPNSPVPAIAGNVQQELDVMYEKAREEFQKKFGKLEVPSIPEKKTLRIQSLNEPPISLRKKSDDVNDNSVSPKCSDKDALNQCKNEEKEERIMITDELKIKSLIEELQKSRSIQPLQTNDKPKDFKDEISIENPGIQVNIKTTDSEISERVEKTYHEVEKVNNADKVSVDPENSVKDTTDSHEEKFVTVEPTDDSNKRQQNKVLEVNESQAKAAADVSIDGKENLAESISDYPECDQPERTTSEDEPDPKPKGNEDSPVEIIVNVDIKDGLHLELSDMDNDVLDKVNRLKEDIISVIKDGQKRNKAGGDLILKPVEPIKDDESGEVESSDENDVRCSDKRDWKDDRSEGRRLRSMSRRRTICRSRSRSFTRYSSRSPSYDRSKNRSDRSRSRRKSHRSRSRSRSSHSHSYHSQRSRSRHSRSRSKSFRSRRRRRSYKMRNRYRRSSHSSGSISSRSSSLGSRRGRSRSIISCSTCSSRSYSRSRSRSFSRSLSRKGSHSRSRSRSRSSGRYRHRSTHQRRYLRDRSVSRERRLEMKKRQEKEWEDRRVLYIGNIKEGTTRRDISLRFSKFGIINRITLHFREHGDNYCFVTFAYTCDAYAAVEFGNEDPTYPKYDICFGGRRSFCRTSYADLDNMHKEEDELKYGYDGRAPPTVKNSTSKETDFDALLKQALKKVKNR